MSRRVTCVFERASPQSWSSIYGTSQCQRFTTLQKHERTKRWAHSSPVARPYRQLQEQRTASKWTKRCYATKTKRQWSQPVPTDVTEKQKLVKTMYNELDYDLTAERGLPEERQVLTVLETYHSIAEDLLERGEPTTETPSSSATSTLYDSMNKDRLDSRTSALLSRMSKLSAKLIDLPTVFISRPILKAYVELQSKLGKPRTLPDAFDLYRFKELPRPTKETPFYKLVPPSPRAPSVAVNVEVANTALSAAIKANDMDYCLAIIETSLGTPAQRRAKLLRTGTIPVLGAVAAPFAAYTLGVKYAHMQQSMDLTVATWFGTSAIMTYMLSVGTMGYIAVTTANDQMLRVRWRSGYPLWKRWAREDERAAADRVAQAWGFEDPKKWGDEEGRDWEVLREWCAMRNMVLDQTNLLPHME